MNSLKGTTAFKPGRDGFNFPNSFPITQILGINIGTMGLCGGMIWAALDRFFRNIAAKIPPDTVPPKQNTQLYKEILSRQIDSLKVNNGNCRLFNECLIWMLLPDSDNGVIPIHGVGYLTQKKEWPKIKTVLDLKIPASVCLVTVGKSAEIWKNHQVLVTGYEINKNTNDVNMHIYDPNFPKEDVSVTFKTEQKNYDLWIKHSKGKTVRGFFYWEYDKKMVVINEPKHKRKLEEARILLRMI